MTGGEVALISGSYPPRVCGIADYTSELAAGLRSRGARVTVYTGCGEAEAKLGIRPVASAWNAEGVRALVAEIVRDAPALVHLQWEPGVYDRLPAVPLLLPRLLRRAGLPLVTTFHSLDGPDAWGKASRLALLPLLLSSRGLIVCSRRQMNFLRHLPGVSARAALIPIGSNIAVTHRRADAPPSGGPLRLVYFGFVWRGRSVETLLKTLRAVRESGIPATLDIVGGIKDAAYRADLDRLSVELGVAAAVQFRSDLTADAVSAALAAADIVLLPFGTGVSTGRGTLMAALAHHVPIVTMGASDNLSPLFEDGANMSIAAVGDDHAFVARTVALAGDAAARARLSAGAAQLSESFTWDAIAAQTLALPSYRSALAK